MRPERPLLAVLVAAVSVGLAAAPEPDTPLGHVSVSFEADARPVSQVLSQLSRAAGREIVLIGGRDLRVTASARDIGFGQALRICCSAAELVGLWRGDTLVLVAVDDFVAELPEKLAQGDAEATALAAELLASLPNKYSYKPQAALRRIWESAGEAARLHVSQGTPAAAVELLSALAEADPGRLPSQVAREVIGACVQTQALDEAREALRLWQLPPPAPGEAEDREAAWQVVVGLCLAGEGELAADTRAGWELTGTGWLGTLRTAANADDAQLDSIAGALEFLVSPRTARRRETRQFALDLAQRALASGNRHVAAQAFGACLAEGARSVEELGLGWRIAVAHATAEAAGQVIALAERWSLPRQGWPAAIQDSLQEKAASPGALTRTLAELSERYPPTETEERTGPSVADARRCALELLGAWVDAGDLAQADALWARWCAPALDDPAAIAAGVRLAHAHLAQGEAQSAQQLAAQLAAPEAVPAAFAAMWQQRPSREALHMLRATIALAAEAGEEGAQRRLEALLRDSLGGPRVLTVAARAHPSVLGDADWRAKTRARIQAASEALARQFNISLELTDLAPWRGVSEDPFAAMPDLVNVQEQAGADLALGFAVTVVPPHLQHLLDEETSVVGISWPPFRGRVLVRDLAIRGGADSHALVFDPLTGTLTPEAANATLVHELGHAFGAVHSPDGDSVMSYGLRGRPSTDFDESNAAIVRAAKWVDFQTGPDSLDEPELDQLVDAYRRAQWSSRSAQGVGEFLATALCARARLWWEQGNMRGACRQVVAAMSALTGSEEAPPEVVSEVLGGLTDALTAALENAPDDPRLLAAQGAISSAMSNTDTGLEQLRWAAALDDSLPEVHLALAAASEAEGDLRGALQHAQAAAGAGGDNPDPKGQYLLGRLLATTGDLEAAVAAWQRTLTLAPDHVRARSDLALARLAARPELGRFQLPLVRSRLEIALDPADWSPWQGTFERTNEGLTLTARHLRVAVELRLRTDADLWNMWASSAAIGLGPERRQRSLWLAVESDIQKEGIVAPRQVETLDPEVPGAWATGRVYETLRGETSVRQAYVLLECPEDRLFVVVSVSGPEEDFAAAREPLGAVLSSLRRGLGV
ncbi:MAG: hypothetical protein ACE5R4_04205 [Armatimonadota bacterium]